MDKETIDLFIDRMERAYDTSQEFREKARESMYRLVDCNVPDDRICRFLTLIENCYKLRAHNEAARQKGRSTMDENIAKIVAGSQEMAKNLSRMSAAYTATAEMLTDSSGHLHGAARHMHETGILLKYSSDQLKDSARKLDDMASSTYEENKEKLGIPPKDGMH